VIDRNPAAHLGQKVTLEGVAYDAHLGAVLMLSDRTPVYIRGLESWDDAWFKKQLHVTGTLRRRKLAPDPEVNAAGEVSHGAFGDDYVLEAASWALAP
jgi:hypothetical protein